MIVSHAICDAYWTPLRLTRNRMNFAWITIFHIYLADLFPNVLTSLQNRSVKPLNQHFRCSLIIVYVVSSNMEKRATKSVLSQINRVIYFTVYARVMIFKNKLCNFKILFRLVLRRSGSSFLVTTTLSDLNRNLFEFTESFVCRIK